MTLTQPDPPLAGGRDPVPARSGGHRRRLWVLLFAGLAAAVVAAAIVLVAKAEVYQPLGPGTAEVTSLPGLAKPVHARQVNTFGLQAGQFYIPPQRGTFGLPVSLGNGGSRTVTIEAVTLTPPGTHFVWPLSSAGPVLYWPESAYGKGLAGRPIAGLSLKPGQVNDILVGIPLRTSSCYYPTGFSTQDSFYVKERFLTFTKWVQIPLPQTVLINGPAQPARPGPGVVCLSR